MLCDAPNPYGGSWGRDGTILFAPDEGRRPALVPETGGIPQPIVVKNSGGSFRQPDILPGGKAAIVSNALRGNVGVLLVRNGRVPSPGGTRRRRPVCARVAIWSLRGQGHCWQCRLILEKLAVTGPESVILEGVRMDRGGPGGAPGRVLTRWARWFTRRQRVGANAVRPVWVDRQGKPNPSECLLDRTEISVCLPTDERSLSSIANPNRDLWVQDLERGTIDPV